MRICVLVWFVLVALVLFSGCALDSCAYIGDCNCSTCDECELELNTACTYVNLTADIVSYTETCIDNPANFIGKTFDCQGFNIDGTGIALINGIYLGSKNNNTIQNCNITDFGQNGVYFISSSNNNLINNSLYNNANGIYLSNSSNSNNLMNNTAVNNTNGLYITGSTGNNVVNTTLCANIVYDLYADGANSGSLNICDRTTGWNDAGTTGCTFPCYCNFTATNYATSQTVRYNKFTVSFENGSYGPCTKFTLNNKIEDHTGIVRWQNITVTNPATPYTYNWGLVYNQTCRAGFQCPAKVTVNPVLGDWNNSYNVFYVKEMQPRNGMMVAVAGLLAIGGGLMIRRFR